MEDRRDTKTERPVALVTGASSGIGAEFARALAARGYDLVLVARRRERLRLLAEELSKRHAVHAEAMEADLAREGDLETVAGRIAGEARFRLLVNNAGFGLLGDFADTEVGAQLRMYRVHVFATMRLSHAALPRLIGADDGGIINVASVAGFMRMPGHAGYASTKAWMIAFTECLHLELRSAGSRVVVQALCPGYTYTEFHDRLGIDRQKLMSLQGFWMTAAFVVAQSLAAFDRGRWLVIPGWRYRLLVFILEKVPRPLLHPIAMRVARRRAEAAR